MRSKHRREIYRIHRGLSHYIRQLPLQISLTFGIALITVLGIGVVVGWTSWEMNHMEISTHVNNPDYVSDNRAILVRISQKLYLVSMLVIIAAIAAIAGYIRFTLAPLHRINRMTSRMTATSSFMDLDTQLNLDFLPVDIKGLVQAYQNAGIRISNMQEQQRQFINNLSHELRTPLTIVYGYLQSTLRRSSNFSEAQRQGLEVATLETDRTIGILQELLEQGRVDSEHIDFYWENLDLNTLVQDVVEMIRDSPMPSPEIILEMATSLIIVRGDRMHLKQAVLGSIDNALKHSNSASAIFVKIKQLGDRVSLKICDRDRYIPPDLLSHIFERFYRMDATHDAIPNSSDFSLVSVKSLIEAMGGTIEVESQQGEGTTFAINLPTQSSG